MNLEFRERVVEEEYWSGHSFEDNCRWVPRSQREYLPNGSARKLFTQAAELSPFLDNFAGKEVVRTFDEGTVFDANQFPEGTIIRFSGESLFRRPKTYNSAASELFHDKWENDWGITVWVNGKNGRMVRIIRFGFFHPERDLLNPRARFYPYKRLFIRPIEPKWLPAAMHEAVQRVGEVNHRRTRGINIPLLIPGKIQAFERIGKIELVGFGQGVREKVLEKERVVQGDTFLPIPQKI